MIVLAPLYASIFSVAAVCIGGRLLADVPLLAFPVHRPGAWLRRFHAPHRRARRHVEELVQKSQASLLCLGVQPPDRWLRAVLIRWRLAERGEWWSSWVLALMAMTALTSGLMVAAAAESYLQALLWVFLPSWSLQWLVVLHVRLSDIAMRRGSAEANLYRAAVDVLLACGTHHRQPRTTSTVDLVRCVRRLRRALVCYARFGLPRCAQGRARDVAQATILDRAFAEAIDSVLADRRQLAALASRVVDLMNALARQEPLSMVGDDGAVVDVLEGGRTFKPWRAAGVLLLAFSVCSGVALGFQSLGLESACLSAMLSVFAACAWTVMDRYGVLGGCRPPAQVGTTSAVPGTGAETHTEVELAQRGRFS
ncbi:hypothetical protein ACLF6K_17185 [Streptomyces xanthophaeus]|uniref:hypothetical protein n=1 Tax=Streptomyces xanthophaeus TaxID=67385 RepID=UPI00398FFE3F